jgi:glucoamylase
MKTLTPLFLGSLLLLTSGCQGPQQPSSQTAPGAPGTEPTWAYSGKTGIGTSYEAYDQGNYSDTATTGTVSKVWFSLAEGILTETIYGLIHEAQLKDMQLLIQGPDFLHEEKRDTLSEIDYLHKDDQGRPLSLAYRLINRDKQDRYTIEKQVFTDPDQQSLIMKVILTAKVDGLQAYLQADPHVANTGSNDRAWVNGQTAFAQEGETVLALTTTASGAKAGTGFMGVSDAATQLRQQGQVTHYTTTGATPGNVAIYWQMPEIQPGKNEWLFVLGFGESAEAAQAAADASLARGYENILAHYNGEGDYLGWEDYLASLPELPPLADTATDKGKLLHASALVLKAQEDKTHAGALIASLSNPWGDTKSATRSHTGYKAVWPRDFYQVAMAMLALGDRETPRVAFEYLQKVQVSENTPGFSGTPGWFLQKTQVDGQLEWIAVQMDQTAMPIMLGWRLWQAGLLNDDEAIHWYNAMLRPAADFLARGGKVKLDWSDIDIAPPFTQQERWEEQQGYSPSTTAAIVAGLVTAADLAQLAGDKNKADFYLQTADRISAAIESQMFTTQGALKEIGKGSHMNGRYYLRITENTNPNDRQPLATRNGVNIEDESLVVDGGFLELVRYGVRAATDPHVLESLPELDDMELPHQLRVKYQFTFPGVEGVFPGWRRYGIDGYGEDTTTGLGYGAIDDIMSPGQRGRVWPFFTGERAHYELARAKAENKLTAEKVAKLRNTYVKALELFANEGLMLPEQVWDGVGNNSAYHYTPGQGTNSATPLAWTHAEYVKLLRSLRDQQVWDNYSLVQKRYVDSK